MKMTLRWYGKEDKITLEQIRQIPGMQGVVWALFDIPVGDVWPLDKIKDITDKIKSYGLDAIDR